MIYRSYGELQLTESSPPQSFTEPVTVAEAKAYTRILTGNSEDFMFQIMIRAAREIAEIYQGVDLVPKQYDLYLDQLPPEIALRQPLRSVDLFQATDSQGAVTALTEGPDADYQVHLKRGVVTPSYTLDSNGSALVRFTSGYPRSHPFWLNAGSRLMIAMLVLISGWHTNRLPFDPNAQSAEQQLPPWIVDMLSWGARPRVF